MSMFSPQLWFCNSCGREMHSPPGGAMGRNFRVCSRRCVAEMGWREVLSMMNQPYKEDSRIYDSDGFEVRPDGTPKP